MTVTLIVEPGTGLPTANSYATVDWADSYFGGRLHADVWTDASTADKTTSLVWATQLLDERVTWFGIRTRSDQALGWPRYGVSDRDGYLVASDAVPLAVRRATAELARLLLIEDRTAERDTIGFSSLKAGPLELEIDRLDQRLLIPAFVMAMLAPYLDGSGGLGWPRVARLVRT
jgi:hypothetical protein